MIYDFFEKLFEDLQRERLSLVNTIIQGFHDFNAYKFACGKINGIELTVQLIKARLEKELEDGN